MGKVDLKERKKRRRERLLIIILIPIIAILAYIEGRLFTPDFNIGIANSLLFFILVNINVILLLLLIFLVFRNLVKLIAERKRGIIGSKIRTKLVILFISLALLPTLVLFGVAIKFVFSTFNYWFNLRVEQALSQALEVGHAYYQTASSELIHYGEVLAEKIMENQGGATQASFSLPNEIKEYNFHLIQLYNEQNQPVWTYLSPSLKGTFDFKNNFAEAYKNKEPITLVKSLPQGDLVYAIIPLISTKAFLGTLVVGKCIPLNLVKKLEAVRTSVEDYKQLALVMKPFKLSLFITFSIITLLLLFAATWIGFHLAKVITAPIQALAAATQEVAKGNLDIHVDVEAKDEVGMLVSSFNKMIKDLKTAYEHLRLQNIEIERRRKYIETILNNIKTGVISTDAEGNISTVNPAAEQILGIEAKALIGQHFKFLPQLSTDLKEIFYRADEKEMRGKQIRLQLNGRRLSLLVSTTLLKDKRGNPLGYVFVFEDITQLEKIERMTAWREVARRIAHEIKNPLTPIQLSAQRLRRRYLEQIHDEGVFDECTQMIVKQTQELKKMVNEFSNFARLPEINPMPNDLSEVVKEALAVYRNAHPQIEFKFNYSEPVPVFSFDREQIKRALLNLLDNAVASIEGKGKVEVDLSFEPTLKIARLEIKDTGRGIPEEVKQHLFEPYFSTKKAGTGLGLAIVHTIISDHQGFIRVKDNLPQGTVFIIELPVRS
ncbi:MAG: PAS domain S-box protein [Candidatus Desulfofervidaceae bacterium]|nr:PAS domain S-box protein [Candidatus Desulfofervidaceae bacterium]MDL1971499.1 ATP-binding protein [Candidatus Desulfofervidaceae bacterium]